MIIGMRGHDFGRLEPDVLAAEIAKNGFKATQLAFTKAFPKPEAEYMTPEMLKKIREIFTDAGIQIAVMGCYVSASDKDPEILSAAKARFSKCLEASKLLGAGCVGTETTHFTFPESEREAAYLRLLDFTSSVAKTAEKCGATIGIEPVAVHTLNTPELTGRLLREVNSPSLHVILDTANLITPATTAPEAQMEVLKRALSIFGDKVCALHIKDGVFNSEGKWENRPLGAGIMDWPHMFPVLREKLDHLCAMREDVWPGIAARECEIMHEWAAL
ncbi:MAG: sugar phosphate isomerase/epimerase [Clostridia bacterium]|nr:sugar phosphate isomerase/epimerase [Clostridia bacterium]